MYLANSFVIFKNLNINRFDIIMHKVMVGKSLQDISNLRIYNVLDFIDLPSPKIVSELETYLTKHKSRFNCELKINYNIKEIVEENGVMEFKKYFDNSKEDKYHLFVKDNRVYIWIDEISSSKMIFKGFFHAYVIRYMIDIDNNFSWNCFIKSKELVNKLFTDFYFGLIQAGWETKRSFLCMEGTIKISYK